MNLWLFFIRFGICGFHARSVLPYVESRSIDVLKVHEKGHVLSHTFNAIFKMMEEFYTEGVVFEITKPLFCLYYLYMNS